MIWFLKLLFLLAVTPFCLVLSLFPGYDGPLEWFEYLGIVLYHKPDGWLRYKLRARRCQRYARRFQ